MATKPTKKVKKVADDVAIALGYGSLYNHSSNNNAEFTLDVKNKQVIIVAKEFILRHDQILINYGVDENILFEEFEKYRTMR
jgi:hypothetical protein